MWGYVAFVLWQDKALYYGLVLTMYIYIGYNVRAWETMMPFESLPLGCWIPSEITEKNSSFISVVIKSFSVTVMVILDLLITVNPVKAKTS